jgi:glycine/D-amino acid oxidase-like deaminating enzyme
MSSANEHVDVAVIGAGIAGISVAYYLTLKYRLKRIAIVDPRDPMSLTSAQSGENYRNWWPDSVMRNFTEDSIELMEKIACDSRNAINMTRRGYALVTRSEHPANLIGELHEAYGERSDAMVRIFDGKRSAAEYQASTADWTQAPSGVDVLSDPALIRRVFPVYKEDVKTVLHVRRAGSISGQQLGQYMLDYIRSQGGRLIRGELKGIDGGAPFNLAIKTESELIHLSADKVVNAAGPFVQDVARMLGEDLPVDNIYQQKISFEDRLGIVPRDLPFTIDLDGQRLAWSDEDREILRESPETAKLTEDMVGGIHCRPDGAFDGKWIKLGWAYNSSAANPHDPEPIDPQFPDTVLRGASRLQPGLAEYIGRLPRNAQHYGGYYTMTKENWPLIGPSATEGAFVVGALSGFGTMAACASGSICADWVMDVALVPYAKALSSARYFDSTLAAELSKGSRGLL